MKTEKTKLITEPNQHQVLTAINHADRKSWWCGSFRGSYNKDLVDRLIEIKRNKA